MSYFQFDVLRVMSSFITRHDLKNSDPDFIRTETALPFSPKSYTPWRNYSRIFKLCLLVAEVNGRALATPIAGLLSRPGVVTCDEYLHFIAEATTDPSPALSEWSERQSEVAVRNPLCFALKYMLAKKAVYDEEATDLNEIIGAYRVSDFIGSENDVQFIDLLRQRGSFAQAIGSLDIRQARESLKFLAQISYLNVNSNGALVSLSGEDAMEVFTSLNPIEGEKRTDGNQEILRVSEMFKGGSTHDFFDYKNTVVSNEQENGFIEGSKVKRTHMVIERNVRLRELFFHRNPTAVCDVCNLDTHMKYPWTERILDVHHILPLSSGTRVDGTTGTILDDLRAICPTCHRAVHRYYDLFLKERGMQDFDSQGEALEVYSAAKAEVLAG